MEWVEISFSRGSSWSGDRTCYLLLGRQSLYHWATWEALRARKIKFPLRVARWLESITDSMDMNLSKLWEIVEYREAWPFVVHGVPKIRHGLATKQQQQRWSSGKESACQFRRRGFDPCVRKISWRRKWQPISVFLPGESYGHNGLSGYNPWGCRESDMTWWLNNNKKEVKWAGEKEWEIDKVWWRVDRREERENKLELLIGFRRMCWRFWYSRRWRNRSSGLLSPLSFPDPEGWLRSLSIKW